MSESLVSKRREFAASQGIPRPLTYTLDRLRSRKSAAFFVFVWSHQNAKAIMEKYLALHPELLDQRKDVINPSVGGLKESWKTFADGQMISLKKRRHEPVPVFYDDKLENPRKSYVITARDLELGIFSPQDLKSKLLARIYKRRQMAQISAQDIIFKKRGFTKRLRELRHPPLDHLRANLSDKTPPCAKGQISVLSYNILISGLDVLGHEWAVRQTAVISLIKRHDIIGLQEVTGIQYADLKASLPDYKFVAINAATGGKLKRNSSQLDEGMVVGYRRGSYVVQNKTHWWISSTPSMASNAIGSTDGDYHKLTQRIEFIRKKDNRPFVFYNNHFPHGRMDDKPIDGRMLAAEMELNYMYQDIRRGVWFVSVGDRNFQEGRDQLTYEYYLRQFGVGDASQFGNRGHCTTILGFDKNRMDIDESGRFVKSAMLDIIFYGTEQADVLDFVVDPVEYSPLGDRLSLGFIKDPQARRFGSDHAAVSVVFGVY